MSRTRGALFALIVPLLALSPGLAQAQTLYGIAYNTNQLITIDPATGAGTLVAAVGGPGHPFGIAFRGTKLYTYTENAPQNVAEVDPTTGAILNNYNIGAPAAWEGDIVFRSDGIGFLTSAGIFGGYQLFTFDITVPSSAPAGPVNPVPIDGLAFNPAGVLYAASEDATTLYTMNTVTGALTLVGNTGLGPFGFGVGGLEFDSSGTLFFTSSAFAGPSNLYTLNPATGVATLVGPIGFNGVCGLRFFNPSSGGPGGSGGAGGVAGAGSEGSFVGIADPPNPGAEGGFGLGGGHLAMQSSQFGQQGLPTGLPSLMGPLFDVPGGGQVPGGFATSPPSGAHLRVVNVSSQANAQADGTQQALPASDGLDWALAAGLTLTVVLALAVAIPNLLGSSAQPPLTT